MRILYYCDWFKEYTAELVLAVAKKHHEVSVIVRSSTREFDGRRQDEADVHSLLSEQCNTVVTLPGGYFSKGTALVIMREFFRRKNYSGYDIFHLQITYDPRFLWLAWRMPTVLTIHEPNPRAGLPREPGIRGMARRGFRHLYRRFANVIIVHTESGFRGLAPHEGRKAIVIPHGVVVRAADHTDESNTILFFGRAAEYKGIDTLMAAMKKVWKVRPDAGLRILASPGDGIGGRDTAILDPRVHATWYGYSKQDLELALSNARAVCMPYLSVTGSGVGAQALGAGRPIVASDLEGLRELVSHEDLLVEPGSADDLARALLAVLSKNYEPRPIDSRRTWSAVAQAHLAAYASLSGGEDVRYEGGWGGEARR